MNRLKLFFVLLLIALMVFLYHRFFRDDLIKSREMKVNKDEITIKPVRVSVERAFTGDLIKYATASGVSEAVRQSKIKSMVSARVDSLYASEGMKVKKGDTLALLNNVSSKAALDLAESKLMEARGRYLLLLKEGVDTSRTEKVPEALTRKLENAEEKYGRGKISLDSLLNVKKDYEFALLASGGKREEFLAQRSGLKVAESEYRKAKYLYDHCAVKAPYDGVVSSVRIHPAEFVSMGMEILTIVDLSKIKFRMRLLESDLGSVKVGDRVKAGFTAFENELFPGVITGVDPIVDSLSRTASVTALLNNPGERIKSGLFGTCRVAVKSFEGRLLVPRAAIITRDQRKLLFIVREGRAVWCYADTGEENNEFVEVLSSAFQLKAGEQVIVDGHFALAHDSPVDIVNGEKD